MSRPRLANGRFIKVVDEFTNVEGYHARYRRRNRKKGLCAQCTTPSSKFLCDTHRESLNKRRRDARKVHPRSRKREAWLRRLKVDQRRVNGILSGLGKAA